MSAWKEDSRYWELTDQELDAYLDRLIAYHRRRSVAFGERAARLGRISMKLQLIVVVLLLASLLLRLLL